MNPRNASLRVIARRTVVDSDHGGAVMGTLVEFSQRLQRRASDFRIYANSGYVPDISDTMLLAIVMKGLEDLAVDYMKVTPFTLHIVHNTTVNTEMIYEYLVDALEHAHVLGTFEWIAEDHDD